MHITGGLSDVSISIHCQTLDGLALTGKIASDFALTFRRDGENIALGLVDLPAIDSDHTDGGIIWAGEDEYRLDLPDEAVASGALQVSVTGTVDGGVVLPYPIAIV